MKRLLTWWRSLPFPWRRWRVVERVSAADEVPERIPRRGVVLVGEAKCPAWAVFDCPCDTGHRLMVNLDRARRPFWTIDLRRSLSIYPSIDNMTSERRCHFIIRDGKVRWVTSAYEEGPYDGTVGGRQRW